MELSKLKTDPNAEANGVWVNFDTKARFKIAAFNNPAMTQAFKRRTHGYVSMGSMPEESVQEEITRECLAEHVILGWEGVTEDGKEYPYSIENAKRLLKEFDRLATWIFNESRKLDNFRLVKSKEVEGNSDLALSGTSPTPTKSNS